MRKAFIYLSQYLHCRHPHPLAETFLANNAQSPGRLQHRPRHKKTTNPVEHNKRSRKKPNANNSSFPSPRPSVRRRLLLSIFQKTIRSLYLPTLPSSTLGARLFRRPLQTPLPSQPEGEKISSSPAH